jgi:G3E family GTPase
VTILRGFGVGEDDPLASLLAAERDSRFAIVVNELAEVSVDDVPLQQARRAPRQRVKLTCGLIAYAGD